MRDNYTSVISLVSCLFENCECYMRVWIKLIAALHFKCMTEDSVLIYALTYSRFPYRPQVSLCLFHGELWLWHFPFSIGPHPVSSLHINTFVVSRAFMAGAASQAGDTDSSRAPALTSGLQGSVNVHRGALLLVPQLRCISSFVSYI